MNALQDSVHQDFRGTVVQMARYKTIYANPKFLPVVLSEQDEPFCNDATGAPAYPPAVLLKLILFAYSRGIVSRRSIEHACREHVTFIALCGDQAPHFTTLAAFIRELQDEIANVFTQVLSGECGLR